MYVSAACYTPALPSPRCWNPFTLQWHGPNLTLLPTFCATMHHLLSNPRVGLLNLLRRIPSPLFLQNTISPIRKKKLWAKYTVSSGSDTIPRVAHGVYDIFVPTLVSRPPPSPPKKLNKLENAPSILFYRKKIMIDPPGVALYNQSYVAIIDSGRRKSCP